ncbi:MAG: YceI family protein [Steroidobacteraceae bacterium]
MLGALFLACALAGCPTRPRPAGVAAQPVAGPQAIAPHVGRPYDIVAQQSLLTILVYRGGTLSAAGHNHVIASHALSGTIYLPADILKASFEVRIPAAELTVDEPGLRAQENRADFPPDVSDSARDGTRRNMLGQALLDAGEYPQLVLRAERLESAPQAGPDGVLAHLQTQVREQLRSISMPVHYERRAGELIVSGEGPLRQSDLGLTPFTALMGALAVQDEMRVRFRIVARAANTGAEPAH